MTASGFTFSTPQIKVKLSQEKAAPTPTPSTSATPTPTPTPTPTAVPLVTKKTSITCIKGKSTKKVTALNPKCPYGYRKK
jgi:hypothetical protein